MNGNEEILKTPDYLLTNLDQQRKMLLRQAQAKRSCPACGREQNLFEAAGIDMNRYDFGKTQLKFKCVGCGVPLRYQLALFGGSSFWEVER